PGDRKARPGGARSALPGVGSVRGQRHLGRPRRSPDPTRRGEPRGIGRRGGCERTAQGLRLVPGSLPDPVRRAVVPPRVDDRLGLRPRPGRLGFHPAHAAEWRLADLWATSDQQGRYFFERGDYRTAAARFADPMWRGVACYRAADYGCAIDAFTRVDSPEA